MSSGMSYRLASGQDRQDETGSTRRVVLGAAGVAAAAAALAACSTSSGGGDATPSPVSGIPTSEIPLDGGKVIAGARVVITQPAEGTFKAFDAICPHQGCEVTDIVDNVIRCPCHGSTFDATTGERIAGPAPRGLTTLPVTLTGSTISVR
ncbi:MAG: Rieske (2Fe-2S) protein [Intrasporangium sp.]|uniref:Rieske (2Fe-2S) protein n=1 Tax=Intrasporangium sp. TaxID=1925024 RepID=UPI002647B2E3|nr:Rieske (2Fe-2S) protein [Intrasporangium sp.]MDN5795978.1 Rieske (2Fe-2S) protein [Intrasporangium sp.]